MLASAGVVFQLCALDAIDVNDDVAAVRAHGHFVPIFRNRKFALVRTYRIIILRNKWRIDRSERIHGTFINCHSVAFHLPVGWNFNFVPAFYFIFIKILRSFLQVFSKFKIPVAIEYFDSAFSSVTF